MTCIAIANHKGGVGKTTTSINLSAALAVKNKSVLVVDMDPQGHATIGLGKSPEQERGSLFHVLSDQAQPRCTIQEAAVEVEERLWLVPGHVLMSTLEQELMGKEGGVLRLYEALERARGPWDYIIIDTPPSLGFLTFNALRAATDVIIPVETSPFALSGVAKLKSMIDLVRVKTQHKHTSVTALVTLYDERSRYARQTLGLIRSMFQHQVFSTIIRQHVALREAACEGQSVMTFDDTSRGARSYMALAEEVLSNGHVERHIDPEQFFQDMRTFIRNVDMRLHRPMAKEVYVAGDFNEWRITPRSQLERVQDGHWTLELELPPGEYRYKFIVDGEWMPDPANPRTAANVFGSPDSLLVIE
jgi:chromosome partitioning protein